MAHQKESGEIASHVSRLFQAAGFHDCIIEKDMVGIKLHVGEKGNSTHIRPEWVKPVIEGIRSKNALPFITDTCVLYKSQRDNAVKHLILAAEHGFDMAGLNVPMIIADGLNGSDEKCVPIKGTHQREVSVASTAVDANSLIFLSHITGHVAVGFGGTIKNMGMGFASKKGKLRQHAAMKPEIDERTCTGCGMCIKWCPADAIAMKGDVACIDSDQCIGCGECMAVCRFNAVTHDWNKDSRLLQEIMAEHALGVVTGKEGRVGYFNFLVNVTKDCDCWDVEQKALFPDIGVIAGTDPVALDTAALDLIEKRTGKSLREWGYPDIDLRIQIRHAEAVGMGTTNYELTEI